MNKRQPKRKPVAKCPVNSNSSSKEARNEIVGCIQTAFLLARVPLEHTHKKLRFEAMGPLHTKVLRDVVKKGIVSK